MGEVARDGAFWVMWIAPRQWEGLAGEFDVGQPGWTYTAGEAAGVFIFYPVFGSEIAWSYGVSCVAWDFLRFSTLERV